MPESEQELSTLIERALDIDEIDSNLYVSKGNLWLPPGGRGVFGGQVIGQALVAATRSVGSPFLVHSLHTYFLRPGNPKKAIVYKVRVERDGTSFKTRSVSAFQNGKVIFTMMCSFQQPEQGLEFQVKMSNAPAPEGLKSEEQKFYEWLERPDVSEKIKSWAKLRLTDPFPIEIIRMMPMRKLLKGDPMEPKQSIWIRAKGNLGDRPTFHQCVAAYASDHVFLTTSLLAHGLSSVSQRLTHMATIDHSMWFHAPFRADEWLLFEMECTRTSGNRGLVLGRFYSRDGRLVISCSQEGLIRVKSNL